MFTNEGIFAIICLWIAVVSFLFSILTTEKKKKMIMLIVTMLLGFAITIAIMKFTGAFSTKHSTKTKIPIKKTGKEKSGGSIVNEEPSKSKDSDGNLSKPKSTETESTKTKTQIPQSPEPEQSKPTESETSQEPPSTTTFSFHLADLGKKGRISQDLYNEAGDKIGSIYVKAGTAYNYSSAPNSASKRLFSSFSIGIDLTDGSSISETYTLGKNDNGVNMKDGDTSLPDLRVGQVLLTFSPDSNWRSVSPDSDERYFYKNTQLKTSVFLDLNIKCNITIDE